MSQPENEWANSIIFLWNFCLCDKNTWVFTFSWSSLYKYTFVSEWVNILIRTSISRSCPTTVMLSRSLSAYIAVWKIRVTVSLLLCWHQTPLLFSLEDRMWKNLSCCYYLREIDFGEHWMTVCCLKCLSTDVFTKSFYFVQTFWYCLLCQCNHWKQFCSSFQNRIF